MDDDYYEVIPLDPLHKLEREIKELRHIIKKSENLEGTGVSTVLKEVIDLVRTTQEIITVFMKSNAELQNKILELVSKIDNVSNNLNQLLDILKEAAVEAKSENPVKVDVDISSLEKKIDELKYTNEKIIDLLNEIKELLKSNNKIQPFRIPPPPKPFIQKR